MRFLHILRSSPDRWTMEIIARHVECFDVTIILIQDAVMTEEKLPGRVFILDDGNSIRKGHVDGIKIGYSYMVKAIFEHDRVILW
jgi:ABC-type uncharacterized transport system ATPase subunit